MSSATGTPGFFYMPIDGSQQVALEKIVCNIRGALGDDDRALSAMPTALRGHEGALAVAAWPRKAVAMAPRKREVISRMLLNADMAAPRS